MSVYNLIFTSIGINKKELEEKVNKKYPKIRYTLPRKDKDGNDSYGLLKYNEADNKLYFWEEKFRTLEVALFPNYKIEPRILTEKLAPNFDKDIVDKFLHKPVLIITPLTDSLEIMTLTKKYIKSLDNNQLAYALRVIRTRNSNNDNGIFDIKLYQIMEYIPEVYEKYKNDKDLSDVIEDMSLGKDGPYNANTLTVEIASWITLEN